MYVVCVTTRNYEGIEFLRGFRRRVIDMKVLSSAALDV